MRHHEVEDNSHSCASVLCFALLWSICAINLVISLFLGLYDEEFSLVKAGFVKADPSTVEWIAYFSYGITAFVSVIALLSPVFSSQRLVLPLYLWDLIRLFFTLWSLGQVPAKDEPDGLYYVFIFYIAMLLICIIVEMYYHALLAYEYENPNMVLALPVADDSIARCPIPFNHHFIPTSTISLISERYEEPQLRLGTTFLPGYSTAPPPYSSLVNIPPPVYSSLDLSSPNPSVPAATCFTHVQDGTGEFAPEDPPPYERCSADSPKSDEQLQEQINLAFSAHIDPLELKIEPFDYSVGNNVTG